MKEIKDKIQSILAISDLEEMIAEPLEDEMVEEYEEYDYEEFYSDIYVLVRNIDSFYGPNANQKAAMLVESFLLESMILLKQDPDNIIVESGEFYVKATSFTPDGQTLMSLFEDAVLINTMIELYNNALAENELPRMEAGIGLATFMQEELEIDEDDECECEEDSEECESGCCCDHDHNEFEYGIDLNNTAASLAEIANSNEFDPIVVNDIAFGFLSEIDKEFFENHLEEVSLEDDFIIYHGNIVTEE